MQGLHKWVRDGSPSCGRPSQPLCAHTAGFQGQSGGPPACRSWSFTPESSVYSNVTRRPLSLRVGGQGSQLAISVSVHRMVQSRDAPAYIWSSSAGQHKARYAAPQQDKVFIATDPHLKYSWQSAISASSG